MMYVCVRVSLWRRGGSREEVQAALAGGGQGGDMDMDDVMMAELQVRAGAEGVSGVWAWAWGFGRGGSRAGLSGRRTQVSRAGCT